MTQAPYFSTDTPIPSWARLVTGDGNRIAFEIDARGSGLIGGVTPQSLIPHGETVSLLSSAMIQNTMNASANGYEGISHDLQGFVRGPTGSPVRVWRNSPLTSGDPDKWITDKFTDYRRVTFIDQMPESISPEWIQSTWFTKGYGGQTRFANLEFRDHYTRRYKNHISSATWNSFSNSTIDNLNGLGYPLRVYIRYLDTIVTTIAKGQPIRAEVSSFINDASVFLQGSSNRWPLIMSIGLKFTRTADGGADWWSAELATDGNEATGIQDALLQKSETFVARNAYRQLEMVVMVRVKGGVNIQQPHITHSGMDINVQIDDSVESGS